MSTTIQLNVQPISPTLYSQILAVSPKIITLGSDGVLEISAPLTAAELKEVYKVLGRFDLLPAYENVVKWADLTPTQIDTYIDTNVTDLASARIFLKKLSRATLFLLQRELSE